MTIQPARHECHACCLLRAGFLAFQPVVDNTRGTRVEQVVSSFQKILRGSNSHSITRIQIINDLFHFLKITPTYCKRGLLSRIPRICKRNKHEIWAFLKTSYNKSVLLLRISTNGQSDNVYKVSENLIERYLCHSVA